MRKSSNKKSLAKLKLALSVAKSKQSVRFKLDSADTIKENAWLTYNTTKGVIHFDSSKLKMKKADFEKAFRHASVFCNLGFEVYLLKENHNIKGLKSVDALINGVAVELKYIEGNRNTAGRVYDEGLEQCPNVVLFISRTASNTHSEYISKMGGSAKVSKHEKGLLIMYFEDTDKLVVMDMSEYNAK